MTARGAREILDYLKAHDDEYPLDLDHRGREALCELGRIAGDPWPEELLAGYVAWAKKDRDAKRARRRREATPLAPAELLEVVASGRYPPFGFTRGDGEVWAALPAARRLEALALRRPALAGRLPRGRGPLAEQYRALIHYGRNMVAGLDAVTFGWYVAARGEVEGRTEDEILAEFGIRRPGPGAYCEAASGAGQRLMEQWTRLPGGTSQGQGS